ncbi:MAG TPA: hypothetical protein VHD36_17700 [Pirellulales bacterium]|nr:hypothetical protein [Pirellulales bacterium]
MNDPEQNIGPPAAQFGLRTALAAVGVLAVVSAVAAPYARSLSTGQVMRLAGLLVAFTCGALGVVLATFVMRRRVERQCGAVLLSAPLATMRSVRLMLFNALMSASVNLWLASRIVLPDGPTWTLVMGLIVSICAGFQVPFTLLYVLWRKVTVSIALCENGVILRAFKFCPWASLAGCRWDFERGTLWFAKEKFYSSGFVLPPELREEADRIMRAHVPQISGTEVVAGRPPSRADR